ncbi:hypothetical protein GCM10010384_51510 [Streptomyces djakartensis]|uniref:Uncharacterized protein n=1 Tax=Streptomyces djakartensis TaxID=68193 RepID=A0ABQ3A6D0_9ACTN|nr:hypothetical protein GCM10010384_51510 [Streptomyces djakartensis]
MLTSLRLFSRAPCTRITSWLSATCGPDDMAFVLVAMLIGLPLFYEPGSGGASVSGTAAGWARAY